MRLVSMFAAAATVLALAAPTLAADDGPDLIFKKSTVFKLLTPNDKLATYGIDDSLVEGVACHYTVPERGGVAGMFGVAKEVPIFRLPAGNTARSSSGTNSSRA